jgi:hypothetical protein
MADLKPDNIIICYNKADEDEDEYETVIKFYAEAHKQSECKALPKAEDLDESNVLLLNRQKMGKKTAPMSECVPQATSLH